MARIEFADVGVEYVDGSHQVKALESFSLVIEDSEFVALVGPSGCGKSTALSLIAGFRRTTSGTLTVDARTVEGPDVSRGIIMQEDTLFPWLPVQGNVQFGPRMTGKLSATELERVSATYIERVGLTRFGRSLPIELSGGMRQRAALARALINEPDVLLMDEPFGALDAQTRIVMQSLLLELWNREKKTVFFVTHDVDEAIVLADRVVVMSAAPGRVLEIISPPFSRPRHYADVAKSSEFQRLRSQCLHLLNVA